VTETSAPTSVDTVATRFWEDVLRLSPLTATIYGDDRYDDRLDDPGPAGRDEARRVAERTLAEIDAIDEAELSVEDRITRDMLRVVAELSIADHDMGIHRLRSVDQIQGPQTVLPQLVQFQKADTPERLEKFVARLRGYRDYMAAYVDILDEGRRTGLTAPRIVAERTIEQLRRLCGVPAEEGPIVSLAQVAGDADRAAVREAVEDYVIPADMAYLAALENGYLASTRADPGLWSAAEGEQIYRHLIRSWTTLDLDPADVHQIGLDELASIDAERRAIATANGHGDDVAGYRAALDRAPANVPPTPEALVERATEDIARAMADAPRMFGRLPESACVVRAVEEFKQRDAPFAYYFPPSVDRSRPGIYYVNPYDLPTRTYSKLGSTTYHEAVPGHHFQIALEMENPELNVFRRLGSRMVGGAYVEGWGLYAERLADEMALFRNDGERFGMLDAQAWRAARLVVDTGLHALRWSRQESIDFLLKAGLSETDATIETDRYVVWPGQALTYMIGMREIRRLRHELEERDGASFDLRAFHDAVLGHGALPLATLARQLPGWVSLRA